MRSYIIVIICPLMDILVHRLQFIESFIVIFISLSIILKDANAFFFSCNEFQRTRNISKRQEMPQMGILEIEPFEVWCVDLWDPSLLLVGIGIS